MVSSLGDYSAAEPARVQAALLARPDIAGRYPALTISGVLDGPTRAALAYLQHAAGLAVTGTPDRATMALLLAPTVTAGRVELAPAVISGLGVLLCILDLLNGLDGVVPADARRLVAWIIGAFTPLMTLYAPRFKLPSASLRR